MSQNFDYSNLLFIDIETVPQQSDYADLNQADKDLWDIKWNILNRTAEAEGNGYEKAGIYAEFGQIVCISVGYVHFQDGEEHVRIKSYASEDEVKLLEQFAQLLNKNYNSFDARLCAHNGKEFDFPYIARRMLIKGLALPRILDISGKKPWEIPHLDTMEMWKFGDWKSYISLKLLAHVFGIPSPKDDIDGSMVAKVFWKEKGLGRITKYCEKDVITLIQVFRKLKLQDLIPDSCIDVV